MMAQQVPHQPTDKKRVKVYELRDNDWFDRGTGFCSATYSVADDSQQPKDPRVIVQSEDEPDRLLLETRISKSDEFQKQQDTLIVWTEPSSGIDMALSFQEADGCSMIWKFINGVQQTVLGMNGGPDDSLSDDLMDMSSQINLPAAELGNLAEIENAMRTLNQSASGRDALAKYVVTESYILKLIPLVEVAEDFESVDDLHRLCNIMKMIILLNDTTIIEHAVSDECVLGVVGALEYDPDFPTHKANHRQWLGNQNRYKEVVPIDDEAIRRKIHQTYRLQYLKDVVLARILDDPTFSVLNSLIFFNQVDIVQHLLGNGQFLNDLFSIFTSQDADPKKRKDAVLFIQQCCSIAKNLQPPARQSLYNNFIAHGLLHVIKFGLRHVDVGVRCASTDILVAMIDHDPQMIRQTIYRQITEKMAPLTDSLIDLLLVEVDLGVKSQISDALKVLLDQCPPQIQPAESYAKGAAEFQARARVLGTMDPQQEMFLVHFYDHSAKRLFKPLLDLEGRTNIKLTNQQASMFGYLIEIINFFIRQHQHRAKYFLMNNHIPQRVLQLLSCQEKYLKLVAIRFFRHLLAMNDHFYLKQLNEQQVFGPILETLVKAMPRDNLLSSAGLDLFEFVRKENIRDVMKHLVESYRDTLVSLSHFDTFRDMIQRYDQTQGFTVNPEVVMEMAEPDDGRRQNAPNTRGFSEHLAVDEAQEEYWNASDDEDDQHPKAEKTVPATNGNSMPSKPLVDYASDEDENETPEGDKPVSTDGTTETPTGTTEETAKSPPATSKTQAVQPPERLSEKRRREEDDDDELGKLMQNKRRNSSSASTNASQNLASSLRRKKSGVTSSSPGAGGKKISINLNNSAIATTPPTAATEEVGEAHG